MEPQLHPQSLRRPRLHPNLIFDLSWLVWCSSWEVLPENGTLSVWCMLHAACFSFPVAQFPFRLSLYCSFMSLFLYSCCFWVWMLCRRLFLEKAIFQWIPPPFPIQV
jgi:hypothetical protein